ncbi:MAG TPA: hypothetical protein VD846_08940 [Allosphingosinicella sp.]|nr:hypothetical protein [Allosphingosinicella sp.]
MAEDRMAVLQQKIAELESQIRHINPVRGIGGLAGRVAFSSGDCTNTCTGACTNGCTNGCTGSCLTESIEDIASQPQVEAAGIAQAAQGAPAGGIAGAELFRKLAGGQ